MSAVYGKMQGMKHAPAPLLTLIAKWPGPAQQGLWACRAIFHDVAAQAGIGVLEESLKWGQPSWRPQRPRTGSTLRISWDAATPQILPLFVDCKTDLAARMQTLYPDLAANDGRRRIGFDLHGALPAQAIAHLAQMTFCYHLKRPAIG
ncbi:MAG: hypothetical protein ACJAVM_000869 [Sulfitobacter sp.]|jgi:hypothetical protein